MTRSQDKVLAEHDYDPKMPKSKLVYHVREPHLHGSRVEFVVDTAPQVRRWNINELRHCHAELHGGPGIP